MHITSGDQSSSCFIHSIEQMVIAAEIQLIRASKVLLKASWICMTVGASKDALKLGLLGTVRGAKFVSPRRGPEWLMLAISARQDIMRLLMTLLRSAWKLR